MDRNYQEEIHTMEMSVLQKARYAYQPKLPAAIDGEISNVIPVFGEKTQSAADQADIKALFPNTYGMSTVSYKSGKNENIGEKRNIAVILSGGQAPGGHNVISGLFDAMKKANKGSQLFGFLGGPSGLIEGKYRLLDEKVIDEYRNCGGFDIIGSGRTKLETEEQFDSVAKVCKENGISAVVIIGGDDSNTNAAVLAEYFKANNIPVQVIGCPKTIDGDLKNEQIETSFGFDTATKTYSELIGNIERDANSAKKYWHFVRLMGRSASHVTLECALECQPNKALIGEEIEAKNLSLKDIVDDLTEAVVARFRKGLKYGVALVPEGIVEFIPEVKVLIAELNDLLAKDPLLNTETIVAKLSPASAACFKSMPRGIQNQLMAERDPHGNVQVSLIETEKMLTEMIKNNLKANYPDVKFSTQHHFFGYEGRCAFPSNFDADYCYSLGYNAFLLIASGLTGYMSVVKNLDRSAKDWQAGGIPITMLFNMEQRHGSKKPVIKKALVDLSGTPFKYFVSQRDKWALETCFTFPGAIQYFGPAEVADRTTETLRLEHAK